MIFLLAMYCKHKINCEKNLASWSNLIDFDFLFFCFFLPTLNRRLEFLNYLMLHASKNIYIFLSEATIYINIIYIHIYIIHSNSSHTTLRPCRNCFTCFPVLVPLVSDWKPHYFDWHLVRCGQKNNQYVALLISIKMKHDGWIALKIHWT